MYRFVFLASVTLPFSCYNGSCIVAVANISCLIVDICAWIEVITNYNLPMAFLIFTGYFYCEECYSLWRMFILLKEKR